MSAQNEQQNSLKKLAVVSSDLKKNINYNDFCAITCSSFINTTTGVNIEKKLQCSYQLLYVIHLYYFCKLFYFPIFTF